MGYIGIPAQTRSPITLFLQARLSRHSSLQLQKEGMSHKLSWPRGAGVLVALTLSLLHLTLFFLSMTPFFCFGCKLYDQL